MMNTTESDRLWLARVVTNSDLIDTAIMSSSPIGRLRYNCHSICRAIKILHPELEVVDGRFLGFIWDGDDTCSDTENITSISGVTVTAARHSWLVTPDRSIIDPYPVGYISLCPILVVCRGTYAPFGSGAYAPSLNVTKEISGRNLWRKARVLAKLAKK